MYRAVFLFGSPESRTLPVEFNYHLYINSAAGVALSPLSSGDTTTSQIAWPIGSGAHFRTLLDHVQKFEWDTRRQIDAAAITNLLRSPAVLKDQSQRAATGLRRYLETPQSTIDLADRLGAIIKHQIKEPTWVSDLLTDRDAISLLRSLESSARKILARKTIFLTPKNVEKKLDANTRKFLKKAAQELFNSLKVNSGNPLNVGFIKYIASPPSASLEAGVSMDNSRENTSTTSPKSFDLLDAFVRDLQIQTSAKIVRNGADFYRDGPVLLEGKTGTGKSLGAALIADLLGKGFVPINIAAVTPTLLESRLRGYSKGVFTGATQDTPGWLERANGKVLFLDEVQSADVPFQTQLLDILNATSDEVAVARMGRDTDLRHYNVKVILAVNEPINALIKAGRLRFDLFQRIRSVIKFPSLKELLSEKTGENNGKGAIKFLETLLRIYRWKAAPTIDLSDKDLLLRGGGLATKFPLFDPDALESVLSYSWEGNFRELERFASDLFWRLERDSTTGRVTKAMVDEEISAILQRNTLTYDDPSRNLAEANPTDQTETIVHKTQVTIERNASNQTEVNLNVVLRAIEESLRRSNFVIRKVLPQLAPFNIKTRITLRKYLIAHKDKISADVLTELSRKKFLKLQ